MAKKSNNYSCAFCGRPESMCEVMIPSPMQPSTLICSDCVSQIKDMLSEYMKDQVHGAGHQEHGLEIKEIPTQQL